MGHFFEKIGHWACACQHQNARRPNMPSLPNHPHESELSTFVEIITPQDLSKLALSLVQYAL